MFLTSGARAIGNWSSSRCSSVLFRCVLMVPTSRRIPDTHSKNSPSTVINPLAWKSNVEYRFLLVSWSFSTASSSESSPSKSEKCCTLPYSTISLILRTLDRIVSVSSHTLPTVC